MIRLGRFCGLRVVVLVISDLSIEAALAQAVALVEARQGTDRQAGAALRAGGPGAV